VSWLISNKQTAWSSSKRDPVIRNNSRPLAEPFVVQFTDHMGSSISVHISHKIKADYLSVTDQPPNYTVICCMALPTKLFIQLCYSSPLYFLGRWCHFCCTSWQEESKMVSSLEQVPVVESVGKQIYTIHYKCSEEEILIKRTITFLTINVWLTLTNFVSDI
jgi:hypothetical protein